LCTVKNDYEIQKNHCNSRCQDPRNHVSQLQIDEKHRQWDWQEGWVQKVSKLDTGVHCNFPILGSKKAQFFLGNFSYREPFFYPDSVFRATFL
jgi:hypothetical protein